MSLSLPDRSSTSREADLNILVDTREQLPYSFDRWPVTVQTTGIPTGDYSLKGFEDKIAIERKSLDDLIGCLCGKSRERFERELARARSMEFFAVVIEANFFDISNKAYHSVMNPDSVLQSISAFHVRYRARFLFAGDREGGEYLTHSLLSKYLYEIEKRFQVLKKNTDFVSEKNAEKLN